MQYDDLIVVVAMVFSILDVGNFRIGMSPYLLLEILIQQQHVPETLRSFAIAELSMRVFPWIWLCVNMHTCTRMRGASGMKNSSARDARLDGAS